MNRRYANRLIEASGIAEHLGPIGPKPVSESQLRPLAALEPEEQRVAKTSLRLSAGKPSKQR
jgi:hypothetical protein